MNKDEYYHSGQYDFDPNRVLVWKEIINFLQPFIKENSTVVDLGAGYCDFINLVKALKKYAVDYSSEFSKFAKDDVHKINGLVWDLSFLSDSSVDVVNASNLFEHLTIGEFQKTILEIKRVLKRGGRFIIMQPNYKLCVDRYFDDHTHKQIFTDDSLAKFLIENDFKIILKKPRFLPLEMKSSRGLVPTWLMPFLVRFYITSPLKPFAGQMLFVAEKT